MAPYACKLLACNFRLSISACNRCTRSVFRVHTVAVRSISIGRGHAYLRLFPSYLLSPLEGDLAWLLFVGLNFFKLFQATKTNKTTKNKRILNADSATTKEDSVYACGTQGKPKALAYMLVASATGFVLELGGRLMSS